MTQTTWAEIFAPMMQAHGLGIRTQQETLGDAIINSFSGDGNLVCESLVGTGKSYAALIPMIHKILVAKKEKKSLRGIISTETIALQNQYVLKDLPILQKAYPGFEFRSLKGRSNYLCMHVVKQNARGNTKVATVERTLSAQLGRITVGDRSEIEKILGYEIDDHFWAFIAGSSQFCGENKCQSDMCFSTRARAQALTADIVVINHAILRVDADTREDGVDFGETFLGQVDFLVVDEAHTLESSLVDGWTEELSEWELLDKVSKIYQGVDYCLNLVKNDGIGYQTQHAGEGVEDFIKSVTQFFGFLHKGEDWNNVEDTISLKYLFTGAGPGAIAAMSEYEEQGLERLNTAVDTYSEVLKYLAQSLDEYEAQGLKKGRSKITKARTAARDLIKVLGRVRDAMSTSDGTVVEYGVPYVVTASGFERRNGDRSVRLKTIPLDISSKAKSIWKDRVCVLMSGTLRDLVSRDFRYAVASLGFSNFKEISTDSPFDHLNQQVVYVTPARSPRIDLKGAQFSLDEMVELISAARGRSLVLFTSKVELEAAVSHVRQLQAAGDFPWRILAQEKGVNKQHLFDSFREDTHSVLFASKSAFTGNDFVGETLSLVVLAKFPLPRYDAVCKQQIKWWRGRGFPRYYEMKALEVFHQAAGRLIRSSTDTGVVALLDQRAMDSSQNVYKTARLGVEGLGSPVVQDVESLRKIWK